MRPAAALYFMSLQLNANVMRSIRGCMPLLLALLFLGCSFDTPTRDVDVREWSRAERVVLYSPHFDLLPEPYGGVFNCPSQPLRLYGFETPSRHPAATLLVRVYGPSDPMAGKAPRSTPPSRARPVIFSAG